MTSRTVQDSFDDVMAALGSAWPPIERDSRQAVRLAVMRAAASGHGLFTAATVRRYLPAWVAPAQVGSTFNALRSRGYAVNTGRYRANGGASRNAAKPSPLWKLLRPIPPEAVQP